MKSLFPILVLSMLYSCSSESPSEQKASFNTLKVINDAGKFNDYWYQGKAEISSYDLEQARYGEIHQGHAVMIFVTEDFSKAKKVKLDYPSKNPKDAVPVLKLNATRNFNTGIYPYSMMTSTFTPVDYKKYPNALKVSSTSQEWCGHTFMQLKNEKKHFDFELRSYFESEGEINNKVEKAFLEDDIWTRLRIDPQSLPTGDLKMLPGAKFSRLKHIDYQAYPVKASLGQNNSNEKLLTYQVVYNGINRSLKIDFHKKFPYEIESWEETMDSGFGSKAKTLTTRATRKKAIMSDYWSRNGNADLGLRKELGFDN